MDTKEKMKQLQAPFDPKDVEWRVDRGQKTTNGNYVFVLAYITNRAIQARLDEVFGPFGWKNEFKEWKSNSQICGISVYDPTYGPEGQWITKWDGSDDSNMDAVKGGLSGAMKRAAVQWGIGRYLYNLEQNRVSLKQNGENWASVRVSKKGEKDEYITGYWDTPKLPAWALPEGYTATDKPQQGNPPPNKSQQNTGQNNQSTGQNSTDGPSDKEFGEMVDGMTQKTCTDPTCKTSKTVLPQEVIDFSFKKFGKVLCRYCQSKHKSA